MSKDEKLNLIVMRDDSRVRRYRVRVSWFRFFLYAQIVLLLAAGLGAYGGFIYWVKKIELSQSNAALQEEVSELQMQLERLQNIEEILKINDPEEIQALFSSVTREKHGPAQQPVDLREIFVAKDMRMAGVSNLQIRRAGDGLRLSFELNNLTDKIISGTTSVYFITKDATVIQAQGKDNKLNFEIQRFRRVNSMLHLPSDLSLDEIFALRMAIANSEGESIFIQTYLLANIITS